MKKTLLVAILLLPLLFVTCKKEDRVLSSTSVNKDKEQIKNDNVNSSGHIKIAVLSDVHYMDASLFQNNPAGEAPFHDYLYANPNKALQAYSVPIFEQVTKELNYENPDLVLIAGDLTKDGELASHDKMASILGKLQTDSRRIFVIPGNNDINNTTSLAYNGSQTFPVPNISPADFSTKYAAFGYTGTERDPSSLSYLAKPFPNLWILAIDASKYTPKVSRGGAIKPATMNWIKIQMESAKRSNAMVFGLMHHNLFEHFLGQSVGGFQGTVIDDYTARADSLISWGLKIIFTGHNHSTDISERSWNGQTIYDIETGSLITPPTSYRILELKNKELDISTTHLKSINEPLPGNQDFTTFSRNLLIENLDGWFPKPLASLFKVPAELIPQAVPLARNAYMAHMAGDEKISPEEQVALDNFYPLLKTTEFKTTIGALWTDNGVKDLKWHIKLTNP